MDEMNRRLRDLLDAAVGEPPRRISVEAVRRRVIRRRVAEYAAGAAAVAVLAVAIPTGIGALGHTPGPAGRHRTAGPATLYASYTHPSRLRPLPVGAIVPISTATNTSGKPIRLAINGTMAITPDGKTIYVGTGETVTPVSTATNTPGTPIHVRGLPHGAFWIVMNPDGKTAYVTGIDPGTVTPISTATNTSGRPIPHQRRRD
jgi:DNA-binding beta-propeller fold protein YncE